MKKYLKKIGLVVFVLCLGGFIFYHSNNTRRKSVAKTKVLHFFSILDSDWEQERSDDKLTFISPTMLIDGKFKSMEGPIVQNYFNLKEEGEEEELLWITSFKSEALDLGLNRISDDYICHSNVDFMYLDHYSRWDLHDDLYRSFPRLTSISDGKTSFSFPKGFGFPIFNTEKIDLQTQVLNHNSPDTLFRVKHRLELGYQKHHKNIKPLLSKAVYIQLPFSDDFKKQHPAMLKENQCIPVEAGINEIDPETNQRVSGFWVIPKGKSKYSYKINHQLDLVDSLQLHMIVPHVHPFAERLQLIDKTADTVLYTSNITNFKDKIGLKSTPVFKSEEGITLYADHHYELMVESNNTSGEEQDMMATLFCFFYDKNLDQKLKNYNKSH